jgi:hypothetical protein
MKPDGSLYLQEAAIAPYSDPDESIPHPPILLKRHFKPTFLIFNNKFWEERIAYFP